MNSGALLRRGALHPAPALFAGPRALRVSPQVRQTSVSCRTLSDSEAVALGTHKLVGLVPQVPESGTGPGLSRPSAPCRREETLAALGGVPGELLLMALEPFQCLPMLCPVGCSSILLRSKPGTPGRLRWLKSLQPLPLSRPLSHSPMASSAPKLAIPFTTGVS